MSSMSFLEHLEELRKRIFHALIAVAAGMGICWWYHQQLFGFMQKPILDVLRENHLPEKLVYLTPAEPFNLYLKISALAGLFLTSPYVLYQVWLFISPGLYRREKRYAIPFMVSTIGLFVAGGYFGYRKLFLRFRLRSERARYSAHQRLVLCFSPESFSPTPVNRVGA